MRTVLYIILSVLCAGIHPPANAQTNTAVANGSIGGCPTYNNPAWIYNSATTDYVVNNAVTVTVDQDRFGGYLTYNGSGAMNFAGTFGVTFGASGANTPCIPVVPAPVTGHGTYLCHSQRNNAFTTVNGFVVTPSVSGNIYSATFINHGIGSMCGSPVCNSDISATNFGPSGAVISLTFSRPVSNVRLIISGFSNTEQFTVTTSGGNPTLTSCYGSPVISGNNINGAGVNSVADVNIGGVWYTSITLTSTTATVGLGYNFASASSY